LIFNILIIQYGILDVLEPLPHFSMPDKQALTPIELKSTFTSAREIFKGNLLIVCFILFYFIDFY
jgi:hypothetical protein